MTINHTLIHNHTFRFRVTRAEFEQIKLDAKRRGFHTASQYVREILFNQSLLIESRIMETHSMVKKILERSK